MKRQLLSAIVSCLCGLAMVAPSATQAAAELPLDQSFVNVPNEAKPWAYWWWLKGNVSEQSITHDLEQMKQKGFGGLLMFDARGYHEGLVPPPESKMEFMSAEWRRMLKHSIVEANRLGLQVSVNLSSCAGALKGPWEVGTDAPKKLIWTSCDVSGPKQLDWTAKRPEGKHFWDVAVLAVKTEGKSPSSDTTWHDVASKLSSQKAAAEVINLTKKLDSKGQLNWDVPAGNWTIVRFACATIDGHEYDVDVLDPKAVEGHFNRMGKAIIDDAGPLAGKTLSHFYSVSWEGAAPTWTLGLDRQFKKYRGYDIVQWLPALAGIPLKDSDISERFLRDYYKTLSDCFLHNFYGTLHQLCRKYGLKWHSESGGPWDRKLASFKDADQLEFLAHNDMPQCEFWFRGRAINKPSANAAHIYGKKLAATEAFTHMVQHWSAYPAALKPFGDQAFCDGINHFIWHTFTASPPELGKPGSEYFAGTHINPNVTWFPQAAPFITYLGRNQLMLQQGLFVADVCCYASDKVYQHWGRSTNWTTNASLKLPKGYTYDLVNTDVLLNRLTVKNGLLVLPDGMSYRMMVVDLEDETVPPSALRKIASLAKAGATIVLGSRRPQRAPGLSNYPSGDTEVTRLASELWPADSTQACRPFGKGKIVSGSTMQDVLQKEHIKPDFEGSCEYTHRRSKEADIYFVAGTGSIDCTFRVEGKEPELWNPATGQIRDAVVWRTTPDGRTLVPLTLEENGSLFVVFRKPAQPKHLLALPQDGVEVVGRNNAGAIGRRWQADALPVNGPWNVEFESGRGAPKSAVFPELSAWEKHSDAGIKFFSGAATYRTSFTLTDEQAEQLIRLQLGDVKDICEVRLNGKDLGIVWTAPWCVSLSGTAKSGTNQLEIVVVNTWLNRLVGDAALPAEKRITKTNVALHQGKRKFKVYEGFASEDPLMSSGLMGPVRLEFGREQTLRF